MGAIYFILSPGELSKEPVGAVVAVIAQVSIEVREACAGGRRGRRWQNKHTTSSRSLERKKKEYRDAMKAKSFVYYPVW